MRPYGQHTCLFSALWLGKRAYAMRPYTHHPLIRCHESAS